MRLWSIHPQYLDSAGLVALWREGLLAQKVLRGATRGYKYHPQLGRFRDVDNSIGYYLLELYHESIRRGYNFDRSRIVICAQPFCIPITRGQLEYEFAHLVKKLQVRSPQSIIEKPAKILPHPVFYEIEGDICDWERRM